MVSPIPNSVRKIWDDWNIRGFILLSLSLQTFLILCAPLRKRTSNMWIMSLIWAAYLLADWVANFTIGLIASSQGGGPGDVHLLAFWAPFLLIHLGGPETITSFSLEDNAFWLRHLLGLLFQVVSTFYVFLQSLGPKNNFKLWFPTLVLFLTGIIKYAERTRAFYLGSVDINDEEVSNEKGGISDTLLRTSKNNIGVVQIAHSLSRGCYISDVGYSPDFLYRSAEESFHIIAVELNFIYEILFTKLYVAHTKLGYFFRAMSFGAISVALVCFYKVDNHGLHRFDVVITYTLLCGAMALDSIALFMLILSDWTVAAAKDVLHRRNSWESCWETILLLKYLDLKRPKLYSSNTTSSFGEWSGQILFGRSSESIYTFNLIDYWLTECPKMTPTGMSDVIGHSCRIFYLKIIGLFGLMDLRDKIKYRSSKPLRKDLWEFIYNDLRDKADQLKYDEASMKSLWAARGEWILQHNDCYGNCTELLVYVVDVEYWESLLLWHIATELLYNTDKSNAGVGNGRREYSKTLSDYMLYLLFIQPMMSSVTKIGRDVVLYTCEDAKSFFSMNSEPGVVFDHEGTCKRILEASSFDMTIHCEQSFTYNRVLFRARTLAIELTKLEDKKWDLMSHVWVELLSYAAGHRKSNIHVQSLTKGGEFVTFVLFAMEHLGIRQSPFFFNNVSIYRGGQTYVQYFCTYIYNTYV